MIDNLKFEFSKSKKYVYINVYNNENEKVAKLFAKNLSWDEFIEEEYLSDSDTQNMNIGKNVIRIDILNVYNNYKRKGIGKILLNKILNYAKTNNITNAWLNASSLDFTSSVDDLVKYYKNFGFNIVLINKEDDYVGMYKKLLS